MINRQDHYNPHLLVSVPRRTKRRELGIEGEPPYGGVDIWTAYELSWLDPKGKPQVAVGRFTFRADSPALIESRSLKLYLHSFNQTRLSGMDEMQSRLTEDLVRASGGPVSVSVVHPGHLSALQVAEVGGVSLDGLDVEIDRYSEEPAFLAAGGTLVDETLTSHLLKTNCPITGHPDWATVQIHYRGTQIDHEGLLKYIISLRLHGDFAEHCAERIFMQTLKRCRPEGLTVYVLYTRRGGIDINPFRTNENREPPTTVRTSRQ